MGDEKRLAGIELQPMNDQSEGEAKSPAKRAWILSLSIV
jgi:hypothetical protein